MFASLMIVDPHSVFCQLVRSLIEKRKDLGVMSEASDGHRASDKAREFRPDVIPTEILLPNRNGINLISRLSEADNRARVAAHAPEGHIHPFQQLLDVIQLTVVEHQHRRGTGHPLTSIRFARASSCDSARGRGAARRSTRSRRRGS